MYASVRSREVCSIAELWRQSVTQQSLLKFNFYEKIFIEKHVEIHASKFSFWMERSQKVRRHVISECCYVTLGISVSAVMLPRNRTPTADTSQYLCISIEMLLFACPIAARYFIAIFSLSLPLRRQGNGSECVVCALDVIHERRLWDAGRTVCSLFTFLLPSAASTSLIFWHFTFPMCHVSPIDGVAFRTRSHFSVSILHSCRFFRV